MAKRGVTVIWLYSDMPFVEMWVGERNTSACVEEKKKTSARPIIYRKSESFKNAIIYLTISKTVTLVVDSI